MVLQEVKRAVCSKQMLTAYLLGLVTLIIGAWDFIAGGTHSGTYLEKYLIALAYGTSSLMSVLFPVISAIPFAIAYRNEADSGFYYLYILKMGKLRYRSSKIAAVFISGFLAIFAACFTWYMFTFLVLGNGNSEFPLLYGIFFAEKLYSNCPYIYGLIYTVNAGVQGGVFAVLGLGFSAVIKNKYIAMLLPFAYCIFSAAVLELFNQALNALTLFVIGQYFGGALGYMGIPVYDIVICVIGITLFIVGDYYAHKD